MTQYFKLNKLIFGISLLASVQFSSKLSAKVDIASNSTILSLKEHLIKNAQREEGKQDSVIASPQIIEGNETKPASVDFKLSKSVVYDASINLLAASPEKEAAPAPLFSVTLMDDLQCLNGTRKSVLSAVDRTQTAAGHNYLASLLSQGCTNAQLLQKRQNVIRYLYLNLKFMMKLSATFQSFKKMKLHCIHGGKQQNAPKMTSITKLSKIVRLLHKTQIMPKAL